MAKKPNPSTKSPRIPRIPRIVNRKAYYDYHILEKLETGIALVGSEVKSIRNGQVSLAEGFARVESADMGLYLYNVDIAPYAQATGPNAHEPKRRRKLLAHKHQINKLLGHTLAKGTTIVPLTMYFVRGMVKVEIGIAQGKKVHDKRETIKSRDADRQIRRAMTRKVL